MATETEKQEQK